MSAEIPLTVMELGVTDQKNPKVEAKEGTDQSSEIQTEKQTKKEARQAAHVARMEEARAQKAARKALKRQRYEERQKEIEEKRAEKKARKEASKKAHEEHSMAARLAKAARMKMNAERQAEAQLEAQLKAAEVGSRSVMIRLDRKEMLEQLETSLAQHGEIVRAKIVNMGFVVEFSQASTAKALLGTTTSLDNKFAMIPVMIAANSLNFEVNGRVPYDQVEEAFEKIVGPDSISRITQQGVFVNVCFKTSEQRDTAMSITNGEEKVVVGGEHTIQSTAKGLRRNKGKRKGGSQ